MKPHSCNWHPRIVAHWVVLDSDGEPYLYLCDTCHEVFLEGQDSFELLTEELKEEENVASNNS